MSTNQLKNDVELFVSKFTKNQELFTDFFIDCILVQIGLKINLMEKNKLIDANENIRYMYINDLIINSLLRYLSAEYENYTQENFFERILEINKNTNNLEILKLLNKEFFEYSIFPIFVANLDKLQVLKSNYNSFFEGDELIDYKINIQNTFCHQNMGNLDDDFSVLLQLIFNNNRTKMLEINQRDLIKLIERLQEIYGKIKI